METFSVLLAICVGNSAVTRVFPAQRPVTSSFDVFFDLHLNERLSKESWGWWFETPSRPLWHHSNALLVIKAHFSKSSWRHQMEPFSALLVLCAGNSPIPVNSPHKSQWRGALMFSLICAWINNWVNNREAGDLRRHRGHYDVNVMSYRLIAWALIMMLLSGASECQRTSLMRSQHWFR